MSKEELATLIEDAMTKLQMGFSGGDPENLAEELLPAIPKAHQHDVIPSFWTMLRELDTVANNTNDHILKHWVGAWYKQWNDVTDENHKPTWRKE